MEQLRYHALHLQSQDLPELHYTSDLLALWEQAIATYRNGSG